MFSYRLKSIKQPSTFCCEKVNKPLCLGQLSIHSSLKQRLPASPQSLGSQFLLQRPLLRWFAVLQSDKTLSAKSTRNEPASAAASLEGVSSGLCRAPHIQKGSLHVHQPAAGSTRWCLWEMLGNGDGAVCIFVCESIITKRPSFQGLRKGGIGRRGGICTVGWYLQFQSKREGCKECWWFSDKGKTISVGGVATERKGSCNFRSKTHRGTAGQCNAGIWGTHLMGLWWIWPSPTEALPAPAHCHRLVSSTCPCPACHVCHHVGLPGWVLETELCAPVRASSSVCLLAAIGTACGLLRTHSTMCICLHLHRFLLYHPGHSSSCHTLSLCTQNTAAMLMIIMKGKE